MTIPETLCMQERQLNIHKRCIKSVAVLMFKVKSRLAPSYILDLFTNRELPYNVRDNDSFTLQSFNTITYRKKSLKYYGAKLWSNIPAEIRSSVSLSSFKSAITSWLGDVNDLNNISI